MAVEHIKHWKIGGVDIARIVEINAFEDDMTMLLKDCLPSEVQSYKWLQPHFATPAGKMLISFQAFVLRSRGKNVMIDTCIGSDRKREYDVFCNLQSTFLEDLTAAGFPPESINAVLCTHLHFDHVGWNTKLVNGRWVPTFPQARYLFGQKEWDHWVHMRNTGGYHDFEHMKDALDPVIEAGLVDFINPDYKVTDEITLIPTPGHTPGHVSVHIKSEGKEAFITGDMVHHPIQLIDPERHGNFDMDKEVGARTRRAFVDKYENSDVLIIGSHFCDPSSGWVVRDGKGWKLKTE